jgi:sugar lactone lactonase YvrE
MPYLLAEFGVPPHLGKSATMRILATGLQCPEGPIAMPDDTILLVEIARETLSRVLPDGRVDVVASIPGGPNGAAIGPDGRVYICNCGGFAWLRQRGWPALYGADLVLGAGGSVRFDSLAVTESGNVCIAALDRCAIAVVTPTTGAVSYVPAPDLLVTNLCFGGPDRRTAFVTMSHEGRLAALDWPEPGLQLHHAP